MSKNESVKASLDFYAVRLLGFRAWNFPIAKIRKLHIFMPQRCPPVTSHYRTIRCINLCVCISLHSKSKMITLHRSQHSNECPYASNLNSLAVQFLTYLHQFKCPDYSSANSPVCNSSSV